MKEYKGDIMKTKRILVDHMKYNIGISRLHELYHVYDCEIIYTADNRPYLCIAEFIDVNGKGVLDVVIDGPEVLR